MITLFCILTILVTFALVYTLMFFVTDFVIRKTYKKDTDRKIKEVMFRELGFTYRETPMGKKFLVIDEYQGNRAIQV